MDQRADRTDRQHKGEEPRPRDQRSPFEHDRDRVLYASSFRRLAGITQVASADERHLLHNRLTHSLTRPRCMPRSSTRNRSSSSRSVSIGSSGPRSSRSRKTSVVPSASPQSINSASDGRYPKVPGGLAAMAPDTRYLTRPYSRSRSCLTCAAIASVSCRTVASG